MDCRNHYSFFRSGILASENKVYSSAEIRSYIQMVVADSSQHLTALLQEVLRGDRTLASE